MGHAAFERAQEDSNEYHEWLKEEEALWAAMASCVEISYKHTNWNGGPTKSRRGSRALGTNPRAMGTSPRAKGTNQRAVQVNKLHSQVTI
jgi:hypothetical protein